MRVLSALAIGLVAGAAAYLCFYAGYVVAGPTQDDAAALEVADLQPGVHD